MISSQLDREIGFEQDASLAPAASVGHDLHHMGLVASASAWGGSEDLLLTTAEAEEQGSARLSRSSHSESGELSEPYTFFGT